MTITASDRSDVQIDAVRRAPRERLDNIKLDIRSEGSNLVVIEANRHECSWYELTGDRNNVVSTDFDIKVPRRTSLDVSVFSAPVSNRRNLRAHLGAQGASGGDLRFKTFSGNVKIDRQGP